MFIPNIVCHLIVLCSLNSYYALEQLPEDIATTEDIRDVANHIFSSLKLKRKQDSKLSEYSTIHKHFVGLTQQENDSWKRVTKLTTIDSKIDNSTTDLTTIINEILNEQNNTVETNGTPNDNDVNEYIENFLSTLARLKDVYLVNNSYSSVNSDVLEHFYRNGFSGNNFSYTGVEAFNLTENNNSTDELEFWTPTETRRIYKGERTKIKYFPFLASVHMFDQFTCAGSIIQSSLVITAASCLQLAHNNRFFRENPAFLAVRIGSPFFNAGGERIPVLEVYFHPTYSPRTLKDNIAIMRLEKVIKFRRRKRNVRKIDIDRNNWNMPVNADGVTIAGWGAKSRSNKILDPWSNKVSMDHLPIYPLEECQDIYSKEYVTKKNFCAGFFSKGGGACNRDVGAPGVANGLLMGIASFGAPSCGTIDAPTVFTKVGYYYDWIETIMEQDVPQLKIRTTLRPYLMPQKVVPFVVKDEKKFKIDPIVIEDIKKAIDISNLNRLRMDEVKGGIDQNAKFENFLGTMFKVQKDRNDELPKVKRYKPNSEEKDDREANKIYEEILTTTAMADEGNFEPVKFVTDTDTFDPEKITSRETDLDGGRNVTKLENKSQIDDDDRVDDKGEVLEINGKTTPILEEYGSIVELSEKSEEGKQYDSLNYDSERKQHIDAEDLTVSLENMDYIDKLNEKNQNQLRELQELANDKFVKTVPYQESKESIKNISDNTKSDKQSKLQIVFPEESIKYKDIVAHLNEERQSEVEKHQLNNDQEEEPDAITNDTIQAQLYDNHNQDLIHYKYMVEIDDSPFKKEHKQQVSELDTKESNLKHTRWQQKVKKVTQEKEPDLSEGYGKTNTQFKKIHHNKVMKRDETLLGIDAAPFVNTEHQINEQDTTLERISHPKVMQYDSKDSKHQARESEVSLGYEGAYKQFHNDSEDKVQKPNESKNETIDKRLDKQIDQLLKNLGVENTIGFGVMDLAGDKKVIEDDTLLTFLLMTDNDKDSNKNESIKQITEYNEESKFNGNEGMNIDDEYYEDMTHRSNATDDSYKIMSKSEMYDILADAVQADDTVGI